MKNLTGILFAATMLSTIAAGAAKAADMPYGPPPPIEKFAQGWYLRGDIGMSNQRASRLDNVLFATAPGLTWLDKGGFSSAPTLGLGIGYRHNDWLRFDVTGEYRGKATFRALDTTGPGQANDYTFDKSEWLFLANGYLDLGTWWCVTPFVGAGLGFTQVTISGFRDINVPAAGVAYAPDHSRWNFAWAAYAGLAYKITPNVTLELAYRYLNLGDGQSGDITTYLGGNAIYNPMIVKDISSHDLKLGVRWECCDAPPPYQPPPPAYGPPPGYPPLVRKG
jgi:opacity protein-like surface antigen